MRKTLLTILFMTMLLSPMLIYACEKSADTTSKSTEETVYMIPLSTKPGIETKTAFHGNQISGDILIVDNITDDADYTVWLQEFRTQSNLPGLQEPLRDFLGKTACAVITEPDSNITYSPISAYAALCILTDCTDQNTRNDLLSFCELDTSTQGTDVIKNLIHGLYFMENDTALYLNNSLWIDTACIDTNVINQTTIDHLQTDGNVMAFSIDMGAEDASKQIGTWSEQETNGFLSISPELDTDTQALLMSLLYFKDAWVLPFSKNETREETFTTSNGEQSYVKMMHLTTNSPYVQTDRYQIASLWTQHGEIRFFLPNEDTSVSDLIRNPDFIKETTDPDLFENREEALISWSVPKVDMNTNLDMNQILSSMGLDCNNLSCTALFNNDTAISNMQLISRICMDENGLEAASANYANIRITSAAPEPLEPITMTLDRPFGFFVLSQDIPLFIGCVNTIP